MAMEMVVKRPLLNDLDGFDSEDDEDGEDEIFTKPKSRKTDHKLEDKNSLNAKDSSAMKVTPYVKVITGFSSVGQFLFGYDTGVISGSMLFMRKQFLLGNVWQEAIVSATIVAAAVFAFIGGPVNDKIGRRLTAVVAGILFTLGAVMLGTASSPYTILIGRVVVGCGLGLTSMTLPMYLSECVPARVRGRLLLISCTFGCSGMLCANLVDGFFSYDETNGWRYMLGLAAIPSLIMTLGFLWLPESPRWLMKKGATDRAREVLIRIRDTEKVEEELASIKKSCDEDEVQKVLSGKFVIVRILRDAPTRRALLVGCGLQMFQQLAAINTVRYYTASIIRMAGVTDDHKAIWLSALVAGVNVIFTFVGMLLVDRIGRRKLVLGSFCGVITSLVILALGFQVAAYSTPTVISYDNSTSCDLYLRCETCIEDSKCGFCFRDENWFAANGTCLPVDQSQSAYKFASIGECSLNYAKPSASQETTGYIWAYRFCPTNYYWIPVVGMATYLIFFAPGLGSVPWIVNSEIYPLWARSTGNGLATATNWTFNVIISMSFLSLVSFVGKYGAFWLYTAMSVMGMIFVALLLPETKGRSLEDMQKLFKSPSKR